MAAHNFFIVDVFAEEKYTGNQLAVVRDAYDLDTEEMQKIAREMHFSETTFIPTGDKHDGGYDVRVFTPEMELPFAGHPTLGTAFVIRHEIIHAPVESVTLNLKVGQIPVTFEGDVVWMHQVPPKFGGILETETIAQTLQIPPDEIDARFPVQEISTGVPFLICPLKHKAAVKNAQPDWDAFSKRTMGAYPRSILIFAPETEHPQNQLHARAFVPEVGVPEDPATGSANGCLAGYLTKYRYFGSDEVNVRVEQGYEIQRPSLLFLHAQEKDGAIEVNVGGNVVLVARGELV